MFVKTFVPETLKFSPSYLDFFVKDLPILFWSLLKNNFLRNGLIFFFFPCFLVFVQLVLTVVFFHHRSFKQFEHAVNLIGLSWNKIFCQNIFTCICTKYLGSLFRFFQWQPLLEPNFASMPFFNWWISHLCFSLMQNAFVIV